MAGHVSPRLGIRFEPGEGPDNLKILDPSGQPFATHQELTAASRRGQHRARPNAAETTPRAEDERQRAERLAQKLRELGVEPD